MAGSDAHLFWDQGFELELKNFCFCHSNFTLRKRERDQIIDLLLKSPVVNSVHTLLTHTHTHPFCSGRGLMVM